MPAELLLQVLDGTQRYGAGRSPVGPPVEVLRRTPRRPAAESELKGANANIGAALAASSSIDPPGWDHQRRTVRPLLARVVA